MADQPRFQKPQGDFEDCYRRMHGGGLVAAALWLADRWIARRAASACDVDRCETNPVRAAGRYLLEEYDRSSPEAHAVVTRAIVGTALALVLGLLIAHLISATGTSGAVPSPSTAIMDPFGMQPPN